MKHSGQAIDILQAVADHITGKDDSPCQIPESLEKLTDYEPVDIQLNARTVKQILQWDGHPVEAAFDPSKNDPAVGGCPDKL